MDEQEKKLDNVKKEYLKQLETDYRYSISKFDDQALYIGSGALAISLTFVKDIVPIRDSDYILLYFLSLSFLTITIAISFFSHYKSSRLIDKKIREIENNNFDVPEDRWIPCLNRITTALLSFGIIFLVTFSIVNIYIYKSTASQGYFKFTTQDKHGDEISIESNAWELILEDTTLNVFKLKKK